MKAPIILGLCLLSHIYILHYVLRFTNFEEAFHKGNLFGIWKSNFLRNSMHTAQDQEHFLGNPVFLFLKEATTPVAGFIFAKKNISSHPLRCTVHTVTLYFQQDAALDLMKKYAFYVHL